MEILYWSCFGIITLVFIIFLISLIKNWNCKSCRASGISLLFGIGMMLINPIYCFLSIVFILVFHSIVVKIFGGKDE